MRQFKALLKVDLISALNRTSKKGNPATKIGLLLILALFIIFVISMFFNYFMFAYAAMTDATSIQDKYLIISRSLQLYLGAQLLFLFSNSSLIKNFKDNFLLSLPVTRRLIVFYKVFTKFIIGLLFAITLIVPGYLAFFLTSPFNFLDIISLIIVVLSFTTLMLGILLIANAFFDKFLAKFKFYRILMIFLTLLSMVGWMLVNINVNIFSIPFLEKIAEWSLNFNIIFIVSLVVISLLSLFIGTTLLGKTLGQSVSKKQTSKKTLKFKTKSNTPFSALLKKELNSYFKSYYYLFNTTIGNLMLIVGSVALIFLGNNFDNYFGVSLILVVVFATLPLSSTTTVSISFEGKGIYFIKSLPISGKQILFAKLLTNYIIFGVVLVISIFCLIIANVLNLPTLILISLIAITFAAIVPIIGLLLNLHYYNFDYKSEIELVKQSKPTIINALLIVVYTFVAITFLILTVTMQSILPLIILLSLLIVALILLIIYLTRKGEILFNRLQ